MNYAIIKSDTPHESIFPSASYQEFQGKTFLGFDSTTITKEEVKLIRSKQWRERIVCPVCEKKVIYRRQYQCSNGKLVAAHWKHSTGDKDCSYSESVPHAQTKRFLFERLKERGFQVYEEKVHKFGERQVRADVAVMEQDGKRLKLVVEVQASNTTEREVDKRTYVYYQEGAPISWVLMLDSFFDRYAFSRDKERDIYDLDGTPDLVPNREYEFHLTGSDRPVFAQLMDRYLRVIAVRDNGQVILIRQAPHLIKARLDAKLRGERLSVVDDHYLATLIPQHQIVDVLLSTRRVKVDIDLSESDLKRKSAEIQGYIPYKSKTEVVNHPEPTFIDFESGKTEFNSLDPLFLIQQTEEAYHLAIEQIKKEEQERKRKVEEDKRKNKEEEQELEIKHQQEEAERLKQEEKQIKQIEIEKEYHGLFQKLAEEQQKGRIAEQLQYQVDMELEKWNDGERGQQLLEEQEEDDRIEKAWREHLVERAYQGEIIGELWFEYLQLLCDSRQSWEEIWFPKGLPIWFKKLKEEYHRKIDQFNDCHSKEKNIILEEVEFIESNPSEAYRQIVNREARWERASLAYDKEDPILWEQYLALSLNQRTSWEKETWIDGIPLWFIRRKLDLLEKEEQERLREEARTRKKESREKVKDDDQLEWW